MAKKNANAEVDHVAELLWSNVKNHENWLVPRAQDEVNKAKSRLEAALKTLADCQDRQAALEHGLEQWEASRDA